jgi:hypothetical protein
MKFFTQFIRCVIAGNNEIVNNVGIIWVSSVYVWNRYIQGRRRLNITSAFRLGEQFIRNHSSGGRSPSFSNLIS